MFCASPASGTVNFAAGNQCMHAEASACRIDKFPFFRYSFLSSLIVLENHHDMLLAAMQARLTRASLPGRQVPAPWRVQQRAMHPSHTQPEASGAQGDRAAHQMLDKTPSTLTALVSRGSRASGAQCPILCRSCAWRVHCEESYQKNGPGLVAGNKSACSCPMVS